MTLQTLPKSRCRREQEESARENKGETHPMICEESGEEEKRRIGEAAKRQMWASRDCTPKELGRNIERRTELREDTKALSAETSIYVWFEIGDSFG